MTDYPEIYALSKRFAPPPIDLRQWRIADDYGDESGAGISIRHARPEDVDLADLQYYCDAWSFLDAQSLLYYMHAIVTFARGESECGGLDISYYFMSFDQQFPAIQTLLTPRELDVVLHALLEIWEADDSTTFTLDSCYMLQSYLGLR